MSSTTTLTTREGPIWTKRPVATSSGLVSTIHNRKPRLNSTTTPPFRDVAFAHHSLMVASVDARGHVVVFDLYQNRYRHLKHAGSPGVRIMFTPSTRNDVLVALEDGSVCARVGVLRMDFLNLCFPPITVTPCRRRMTR